MHQSTLAALADQVENALAEGAPREEIADLVGRFVRAACEQLDLRDRILQASGAPLMTIVTQLQEHSMQMEVLRNVLDNIQRGDHPGYGNIAAFLKGWANRWAR